MQAPFSTLSRHFPGIGFMRLLLAVSVVVAHSNSLFGIFPLVGGKIAVQAFYVISGFYMALILPSRYDSPSGFYLSRFFRLYPLYLTCVACAFLIGLSWHPLPASDRLQIDARLFLLFTNITSLLQDAALFMGLSPSGHLVFMKDFSQSDPPLYHYLLVPQAWSLGLEITFYLLAPFLLRLRTASLALLCLASLGIRWLLIRNGLDKDPWNYRFFPAELFFFLAGSIACRFRLYYAVLPRSFSIVAAMGIFSLTIFKHALPAMSDYTYLAVFILLLPCLFTLAKDSKLDREIGDLSYGIYLSHLFLLVLFESISRKFHFAYDKAFLSLYVVSLTIVFSWTFNKAVQGKIDAYRHRFAKWAAANAKTVPAKPGD